MNSSETADTALSHKSLLYRTGTYLNISGNGNVRVRCICYKAKDDGYHMVIEAQGYGTINIHGSSYYAYQKLNTQMNTKVYTERMGKSISMENI